MLEKHADFFRDFRGDTVHPSTMEILDQLGLLERFLERPHDGSTAPGSASPAREYTIGDLSHLDTPAPFIAMMPQWEFLDFLRDEAAAYPGFRAGDGGAGRRLHRGRRADRRRAAHGRRASCAPAS